jgi:hypothetical protein
MGSASDALLSTTLLVPLDRAPRRPVDAWTRDLHGRLLRTRSGERRVLDYAETLAGIGNNAGLIAAFQGERDRARMLCERQMAWQHRMGRRARAPEVERHAVQPWINLGRLDALDGDWEGALARFAKLVARGGNARLCLDLMQISRQGEAASGFGTLLYYVYVVDSLKALLLNRRWAEVLDFAQRCERRDETAAAALDEAQVVAWCRLGEPARAAGVANRARALQRAWGKVLFRLRAGEATACAGRVDAAGAELESLANVLERLGPRAMAHSDTMPLVLRVAQACAAAGREDPAVALARRVVAGAEAAEDETIQIEALRVVAGGAGSAEALPLERLERDTGYARYRRGEGGPPIPHPETGVLYDALLTAYETSPGAGARA